MADAGWMWSTARFEPADALFHTEFSDGMSREAAPGAVLSLLSALPDSRPHASRLLAGPRAGEHDVTVTVPAPVGLAILALVELGDRSPQEGANVWAKEMAAAMRAQGVDAQVAIRPTR